MWITAAKFEERLSNVFGDILNFVIHYSHLQCLLRQHFLKQKLEYLWNERRSSNSSSF